MHVTSWTKWWSTSPLTLHCSTRRDWLSTCLYDVTRNRNLFRAHSLAFQPYFNWRSFSWFLSTKNVQLKGLCSCTLSTVTGTLSFLADGTWIGNVNQGVRRNDLSFPLFYRNVHNTLAKTFPTRPLFHWENVLRHPCMLPVAFIRSTVSTKFCPPRRFLHNFLATTISILLYKFAFNLVISHSESRSPTRIPMYVICRRHYYKPLPLPDRMGNICWESN